MKILVVDDMTSMRHVMLNLLRSIGYTNLEEATNGWQAYQMVKGTATTYSSPISTCLKWTEGNC